jgi:hypothetical protein
MIVSVCIFVSVTKTKSSNNMGTLSGIGNKPQHQYIIADLIVGIRKSLVKQGLFPEFMVLPEFSIGNYQNQSEQVSKNYNFDLCIVNADIAELLMILEVANMDDTNKDTKKLKDCIKNIDTLQEAFLVEWDDDNNVVFTRWSANEDGEIEQKKTSQSLVMNYPLKLSLVSFK